MPDFGAIAFHRSSMHIDHTHCMARSWGKAKGLHRVHMEGPMSLMFLLAKNGLVWQISTKNLPTLFPGAGSSHQPEGLRLHIPPGSEKRKDFNVINV